MFLCWKNQYCENDYIIQIYQRLHYSHIQWNPYQTTNSIFHRTRTKTFTICISSVQSSLTPCDPMNHSTPGLLEHHQLLESTQTHVHWVSDATQPSHPLSSPLLLPSIYPSIRVFSNESAFRIKWPKYWSFSFNIGPSNEHPGLVSFRMDWLDVLAVQGTLKSLLQLHSSVQKHQSFGAQLSL